VIAVVILISNCKNKHSKAPPSGSGWRGTDHYFESRSSFRAGNADYIGQNQRLTVSKYSSDGNLKKIDEDAF
jgi:hypothetical protein